MLCKQAIYPAIVVNLMVSLTTSSDNCDQTLIGSHPECQPMWYSCERAEDRQQYEPPLNCTAWYREEWSRCFDLDNGSKSVSSEVMPSVPLVTRVFLSSSYDSGHTKPVLNIYLSQPTDDKYDMVQLLLRSTREVSDPFYVDPYYEKFPSWKRMRFTGLATKATDTKMQHLHISFGNLDTCNVRCEWGRCQVYMNLYLLTIMLFSSKHQNLPGKSITYQITSYNRRFLNDDTDSQWKPTIMTAILPNNRGIHVVFEPLPPRFVSENTYYVITLQDWETWKLIQNKTILHKKTDAYHGCIFDFHETSGDYEIVVQYINCHRCPFDTWVTSADFTLPEYPDEYRQYEVVHPKISIRSQRRYTEIPILGTVFTVLILATIVFFCRRKIKERLKGDRLSSEETLIPKNNNNDMKMTAPPSDGENTADQNTALNQRSESIATKLEKLAYPSGYIDDFIDDKMIYTI